MVKFAAKSGDHQEQPSIQNERQLGTLGRRILKDGDKDDDDIGKLEGIVNEDWP